MLWEERTSPSLRPSTRIGPGEPLREQTGLVRGPRGHTGRSPGLHLAGSHPTGTGARLQRPPAPGGGQGPRSQPRGEAKREARWRQHLGGGSSPGQAGQASPAQGLLPQGCPRVPALAMASLLPATSRAPYWANVFALLVWRVCFSKTPVAMASEPGLQPDLGCPGARTQGQA